MEINVIKAKPNERKLLRVAAYCRVSSDGGEQETSIENQKAHYEGLIRKNPDYELASIYFDQGISGFKEDRPGFQKMMEDARAGKVDLIITKSITRFARNTDTILKATRELKELGIGVFFELQNINTLSQAGELLMTVYAAFAQGESETYRDLTLLARRRQFEEGRPCYQLQRAFGYKLGETKGTFEIVPEEAKAIKQIYRWVREEYSTNTIVKMAKEAGFRNRNGKDIRPNQVYHIVQNVIYKGDYIMQQHYIDDDRRHRINYGERPSWYIEDDHPAIVSKKLWKEANDVIAKRAEEKTRHLMLLPMTEENYPYKNKLYCGYCGLRLYVEKSKTNAQYSFYCRKKNRAAGDCCPGISVPQKVVESWGEITENIYITLDLDKPIPKQYSYVKESTWRKKHKVLNHYEKMKPYTKEHYPYCKRIFCEKCGWPLYRARRADGKIWFECGGGTLYRKDFCEGVRIPEEALNRLPEKGGYYLIKEEVQDGKKHYSYSCRSEKPQRKKKPPVRSKED